MTGSECSKLFGSVRCRLAIDFSMDINVPFPHSLHHSVLCSLLSLLLSPTFTQEMLCTTDLSNVYSLLRVWETERAKLFYDVACQGSVNDVTHCVGEEVRKRVDLEDAFEMNRWAQKSLSLLLFIFLLTSRLSWPGKSASPLGFPFSFLFFFLCVSSFPLLSLQSSVSRFLFRFYVETLLT